MSSISGAMRRMTDDLLLAPAFAALPMLGSAARWQITALAGGIANRSWLLRAADARLVLRVPVQDTRKLGVDRGGERAAIEAAASAGLAPELVYFEVTTGLMLSRYVEGRPWGLADAHDPHCVARLAERFRLLHGIEPPGGARRLEFSALIADYRKSLAERNEAQTRASTTLDDEADRRLANTARRPRSPVLCHNDVHHRNIVDGESLWLIDWEYAAIGDALYDLASFACYHELDAGERVRLLEAYEPAEAARLAKSFDDYCWLFDYMRLLWLELTASDGVEQQMLLKRLENVGR